MTTLDATAGNATGHHPDHEHDHLGNDHGKSDTVRHWLTARLSDAPPLTPEQLQRLRLLLGVEHGAGMKSA